MASPTPWQLALPKRPLHVKKTPVYAYDPYNFSHLTTTSGTNPVIRIPAVGPNAAGAVPPTSARTVVSVIVKTWGTNPTTYGDNFGAPQGGSIVSTNAIPSATAPVDSSSL